MVFPENISAPAISILTLSPILKERPKSSAINFIPALRLVLPKSAAEIKPSKVLGSKTKNPVFKTPDTIPSASSPICLVAYSALYLSSISAGLHPKLLIYRSH